MDSGVLDHWSLGAVLVLNLLVVFLEILEHAAVPLLVEEGTVELLNSFLSIGKLLDEVNVGNQSSEHNEVKDLAALLAVGLLVMIFVTMGWLLKVHWLKSRLQLSLLTEVIAYEDFRWKFFGVLNGVASAWNSRTSAPGATGGVTAGIVLFLVAGLLVSTNASSESVHE